MNKISESLNDRAWEQLFDKYNILNRINDDGQFTISASQIKEFREPRLMAKFDHTINLPRLFSQNNLSILPISRGDYVISHFQAYHQFEPIENEIVQLSLPKHLQSIDTNSIPSETIALNCAVASGMVAHFLNEEELFATVSGRMGSGSFNFNIENSHKDCLSTVNVNNSQIEIDAAYEGTECLAIFEAKRDLSEDFLIRQLYYPYRVWQNRITKRVRPLFLVYSNGIYRLYEYEFTDINNYSSLVLVQQKNYSIEDTSIEINDIENLLNDICFVTEPHIPFPQADNFDRVINICELLLEQSINRNDVTEQYAFDARQTNYYTDAARYLGLVMKQHDNHIPTYKLTDLGVRIMKLNFKQRQLELCRCILRHQVFAETLKRWFSFGAMPETNQIVDIMKSQKLYNVGSESTFKRRSSTIKGWLNWIVKLING